MNQLETAQNKTAPTTIEQASPQQSAPRHEPPQSENLFSDAEWNELRSQDKLAGTAIVAIMITIFSLGLIGYTAIAIVCSGG
jgi:hypothetical protein